MYCFKNIQLLLIVAFFASHNSIAQLSFNNEGGGGLTLQINKDLVVHSDGDVNNLTGANMTFESSGEPNLEFDRDFTNSTAAVLNSGTGLLELTGSVSQNLDFGGDDLYNLEIINAAGGIFIRTAKVNNEVQFNIGDFITTNDSVLIFETTATSANPTDDSHVNGPVVKNFDSNTEFIYPTGHGSSYNPVAFEPQGASATVMRATYFWNPPLSPTLLEPQLKSISTLEEWDLTRLSGTEDGNVTLSWDADSDLGALSEMVVAYWGGSLWKDGGNTALTSSPPDGTVRSEFVTMYDRRFTLGFSCGGEPSLVGVTAVDSVRCDDGAVVLKVNNIPPTTTVDWYTDSIGGTLLISGSNRNDTIFTTGILTADSSFYAELRDTITGCTSISRVEVKGIVNQLPDASGVTGIDSTRCGDGTVVLKVTGTPIGTTVDWYDLATIGTNLQAGTDDNDTKFTTLPLTTGTTNYFAEIRNTTTGCVSTSRVQADALVNALPDLTGVTGIDSTRCDDGTVVLKLSGTPVGTTVDWYDLATIGTNLQSGTDGNDTTFTTLPLSTGTTNYFAEIRNTTTGCVSTSRVQVDAVVNALPDLTGVTGIDSTRCDDGAVILKVSGIPSGTTVDWYDLSVAGTNLQSGTDGNDTVLTTASLTTGTTNYFSEIRNIATGCVSNTRVQVDGIVNTLPLTTGITAIDSTRCGNGAVVLKVSGIPVGTTVDWYDLAVIGNNLQSGTNGNDTIYKTASLTTETTSYFAEIRNTTTGCVSNIRVQVDGVVNALPNLTVVTAIDTIRCDDGTAVLKVSGIPAGTTVDWYDLSAVGNNLQSGTNVNDTIYTTVSLITGTTNYFAEIRNTTTGCVSNSRVQVDAIVNALPLTTGITAIDSTRCGNGTVVLKVSGTPAGTKVDWYNASTGGIVLQSGTIASDTSYTTGVQPTGTTSYFVEIKDTTTGCISASRVQVNGIVNPVPSVVGLTAIDGIRCGDGAVVLKASGLPDGSVIDWYSSLSGDTILQSGLSSNDTTFTTEYLETGITSYYAEIRIDSTGCASTPRSEWFAEVNDTPNVAIVQLNYAAYYCFDYQIALLGITGDSLNGLSTYWIEQDEWGLTTEVNEPSVQQVVVSDGTCESELNIELEEYCNALVYIPNAFTPNGDGRNDTWMPITSYTEGYLLMIFDRWGQIIFETSDANQAWDGKSQEGNQLPIGVYVFKLEYTATSLLGGSESISKLGTISILR
ncbi:MAG: gliding motility-associated-like protein [Flavobacteriales bacterium]|jgi:gliding motility-associated-like protein